LHYARFPRRSKLGVFQPGVLVFGVSPGGLYGAENDGCRA